MSGTISQSGVRLASNPASAYAIPPHSSTGGASGSRPYMRSQTSEPMIPILGTPTRLIEEHLGRPVDPRRADQLAGHDPAHAHRRFECAAGHFSAQREEEMV